MGGVVAGLLLMLGSAPSPAAAQDVDARWLPWLGCWEAAEAGEEVPMVCVQPSPEGGSVDFVTWSGGQIASTETIRADAVPRNVEREDCQGTEEAGFSDDGHRVYLKSDYACEGGVRRGSSGIMAMVNPMEWVDIKAVNGSPWVLRYRLARAGRVEEAGAENVVANRASEVKAARIAASSPLTEVDVVEAVGRVDATAVEALVVERGDAFPVDADMLVRLDDAGVPGRIIDLMVAVSFPDRFAVKAGAVPVEEYAAEDEMAPRRRIYMAGGFYDPWWGGSWFGYSPYYYGYSSYGYGYGYYGGYGYGYPYYRPTTIVVTPRTSGGRMIRGQGATRGGSGSGYTGGTARPRGSAGSSGGTRSTASPGVRSSGGSSTGRTAKPRGGGGGTVSQSSTVRTPTRPAVSKTTPTVVRTAKPRGGGTR